MIKINNKTKIIKTREIEDLLSLLKKRYKNLDIEIKLYSNKFQLIVDYLLPFTKHSDINWFWLTRVLNGKVGGWYCNKNGRIKLFTFNRFKGKDCEEAKVQVMFDLLHELRHAYQHKNLTRRYEESSDNYVFEGPAYSQQWVEIDANKFARKILDRKRNDINKILNIKCRWDFA